MPVPVPLFKSTRIRFNTVFENTYRDKTRQGKTWILDLACGKYGVTETALKPLPGSDGNDGYYVHLWFRIDPVVKYDACRMRKEVFEREATKADMINIQYKRPGLNEVRQMIAEGIGGVKVVEEAWWAELLDEAPNLVVMEKKQGVSPSWLSDRLTPDLSRFLIPV
ncbi:hypothetical protein PG999_006261 [Apiospora kogelbergensis]|uniref:Uncharacterized protein n=2 Tax=Apiospora kogelbergensis TaxID=1337665 RepID=A0AAW0QRL6_9PEZI